MLNSKFLPQGAENVTHAFMYAARAKAENHYPEGSPEHEAWNLGRTFYNNYLDYPEWVAFHNNTFFVKMDGREAPSVIMVKNEYDAAVKTLHKASFFPVYGTAAKREAKERIREISFETTRPLVPPDNRIWTLSGQHFDLFTAPQEFEKYRAKFNINDIATGLSHICRWGGQVRRFYSVAQHCCLTAMLCGQDNKYYGLMHDTPEAYIDDMQRPMKQNFPEYRAVEDLLEPVLLSTFGLQGGKPKEVKFVDSCLAVAEAKVLGLRRVFDDPMYDEMVKAANDFFAAKGMEFKNAVTPWSMEQSKKNFLQMFRDLKPGWLKVDAKGFVTLPEKTETMTTTPPAF